MDAHEMEGLIQHLLWTAAEEGEISLSDIRTYTEAMLLTTDAGLVVKFSDGSEFQITINRTK